MGTLLSFCYFLSIIVRLRLVPISLPCCFRNLLRWHRSGAPLWHRAGTSTYGGDGLLLYGCGVISKSDIKLGTNGVRQLTDILL